MEKWKQRHHEAVRQFPVVLASSLTKPLLYASVNAIDLLIRRQDVFELEKNDARPKPDVHPGRLGGDLSDREAVLLSVLMNHHGCYTEQPVFTRLLQKEMEERAGLSQSTMSRALGDLLNRGVPDYFTELRPSKRYDLLCENRLIVKVLEYIDNPRRWSESDSTDLANFEDRGF